jgi:hypothetical protein
MHRWGQQRGKVLTPCPRIPSIRSGAFLGPAVFSCLSLLVACGGGPATTPHKLSSGRTIRVISVGQMQFQQSGPALVLSYQTDLKVADTQALRAEVAEIWADFQKDATQARVASAIVIANEVPSGSIIQQGKGYRFVFTRNADGIWSLEPSK